MSPFKWYSTNMFYESLSTLLYYGSHIQNTALALPSFICNSHLQPWTNCVGKCLKTSNHDQKPTKTTSCTPFPLSMLENSKIQTSVTRKVLSQHCTGVGRGKMRGEQNFPTLMAKVVCTRVTPLTNLYLADLSETLSLQQSEAKYELGDKWWSRDGPMTS